MPKNVSVRAWNGLNNVSDPLRLGLGWLSVADNVDISDTGAIERRDGFTLAVDSPMAGGYATIDTERLYVVGAGVLSAVNPDMSLTALATLSSPAPMHWAEINRHVYFNNGTDSGVISPGNTVSQWAWPEPHSPALAISSGSLSPGQYSACCTFLLPDGRETGASAATTIDLPENSALAVAGIPQAPGLETLLYIAPANSTVFQLVGPVGSAYTWNSSPDALGTDMATAFMDPLPTGATVIQHWKGQMFAAQYLPGQAQSVVWASEPLGYHLFNLNSGFFMVPGEVLMLAPVEQALIVGTDAAVYAYTGEELTQVAPYGVVPGLPWAADEDTGGVLIWTKRGVARAMPFENLTQRYASVAPGLMAGSALVRKDGQKKFVTTLTAGGTAFNQRL